MSSEMAVVLVVLVIQGDEDNDYYDERSEE